VTRRKVRFTESARKHVQLLADWWRDNSARPEILDHDLSEAIRTLSLLLGIGQRFLAPIPGVRRFYLERLTVHLYYTYDDDEVVIRAVWHARRGSGPDFGSL
jgi:plasmid stabilization system protein ParE